MAVCTQSGDVDIPHEVDVWASSRTHGQGFTGDTKSIEGLVGDLPIETLPYL